MYRIQAGMIIEVWQCWDRFGLLEQLGDVHVRSNNMDSETQ